MTLVIAAAAAAGLAGCGDDRARFRLYGDDTVVGTVREVEIDAPATVAELARRFGVDARELLYANPKLRRGDAPAGTRLRVPGEFVLPPGPRRGIVVNLPEKRLYFYPGGDDDPTEVLTFRIAIGREEWKPPTGTTHVAERLVDPPWVPSERIRVAAAKKGRTLPAVVPAGGDNPLGRFALRLGWSPHLIHGSDDPRPVVEASYGGIRLYPEDMEALFKRVREGEPVTLLDEPYKFGVRDGAYYVEAHAPAQEAEADALRERFMSRLAEHARENGGQKINWAAVVKILRVNSGVPAKVSDG